MIRTIHTLWRKGVAAGMAAGLMAVSGSAMAEYAINFQQPVTRIAEDIYDLHLLMMGIVVVIFCGVFGVMFYSIFAHRKSKGHKAAQFHENTYVEIGWTVVPMLILVVMAIPATKTLLDYKDTSASDMTVKVTGYQWKWGYDYVKGEGEGIGYLSALATPQDQITGSAQKGEHYLLEVDNPLVVPVGKKVRLLITANDVIHAWWVPAFGVKQDAIPGFVRDAWFKADKEGIYRGQCAELCGKDHGFMPIVVNVLAEDKYAAWVADQKKKMAAAADDPNKTWTIDELKARGEKAYTANCVACHQATGQGIPGAFPALDGSKTVKGPKEAHIDTVLNGRTGTAMAPFKALSDVDLASIITYERNAWNNKNGDMVSPAEIKARRK
jgi:cytochrome c oxidase subunit II